MIKKNVKIIYYAILREQRKQSEETWASQANTLDELYQELKNKYAFSLPTHLLRVSVNNQFARWKTPLKDGDTVIFIPPVAGG
ncbi:MAG: MoaD/ThiS family protein [Candidatus Omnitrophota bacterium]|jgi:molybdopterin converting factor small subunit|nr:MoaD/ThiS family protein [Candidatus Omnitrophota bacterium]